MHKDQRAAAEADQHRRDDLAAGIVPEPFPGGLHGAQGLERERHGLNAHRLGERQHQGEEKREDHGPRERRLEETGEHRAAWCRWRRSRAATGSAGETPCRARPRASA